MRPSTPARLIVGAGLLVLGVIEASPHASTTFESIEEILFPLRHLALVQDQTIAGVAFQSGSIIAVTREGLLVSAELKRPHDIDGLAVIGHLEFLRVDMEGGSYENRLSRGTLAEDQEIPNSSGAWCSRNGRIRIDVYTRRLTECELARDLTRDGPPLEGELWQDATMKASSIRKESPCGSDAEGHIEGIDRGHS